MIWERSARTLVQVTLVEGLRELESRAAQSWRSIVRLALMKLGGWAHLSDINASGAADAPARIHSALASECSTDAAVFG